MSKKPFENPLTPNKLLREMYLAMLEVRAIAKSQRKIASIAPCMEAIWTAPAIGLRGHSEDLVSEPGVGPALDLILGMNLRSAVKGQVPDSRRLPSASTPADRLRFAIGASMAIGAAGRKGVLLAFAKGSELTPSAWRQVLAAAVSHELPIVFVILPEPALKIDLCKLAQTCKLPAIPVDAADPIAIYRVAQESIGRARAGGGAALIAGISFVIGKSSKPVDPLTVLSRQLLAKKACTPGWLSAVERRTHAVVTAH